MDDIEYCAFVKYAIKFTFFLITVMFVFLLGTIVFDGYVERFSERQHQRHLRNTTIKMLKDSKPVDSNCFQLDSGVKIV